MGLDRRLFFVMHRAHRALMAHVNARLIETLGVSSAQLATLYYVAKHDGCSSTDVANLLDLNKSAMSGMVGRLERDGLLKREPNPRDARGSRLSLTAKGHGVRAQAMQVTRRLTAEITGGMSEGEMETIHRFLNAIIDRYADDGETAKDERKESAR